MGGFIFCFFRQYKIENLNDFVGGYFKLGKARTGLTLITFLSLILAVEESEMAILNTEGK